MKHPEIFTDRHIGPNKQDILSMLKTCGQQSLNHFIEQTVPTNIRLQQKLHLPAAISEADLLKTMHLLASKNQVFRNFIGSGYYGTHTPAVLQRNILENPGWYTQYTPYQAEISQGRLEAMLIFQTVVSDLCQLPLANASLLDEGTAAAEAMIMFYRHAKRGKNKDKNLFLVSAGCFPQTIDVVQKRANPLGIEIKIFEENNPELTAGAFGILLQYPDKNGAVNHWESLISSAHEAGIKVAMATDLLALLSLKSPGAMGADVALGNSQRFGVPMFYGGPHAAFFASNETFKRLMPGRIIGISKDAEGNPAVRMALQTREQHIRREKATSNICTAQALLAVMAGMYAVYHGPDLLRAIADYTHDLATKLSTALQSLGFKQLNKCYFDTLLIDADGHTEKIIALAKKHHINMRNTADGCIGIALDETHHESDIREIAEIFAMVVNKTLNPANLKTEDIIPASLQRTIDYLQEDVFTKYHSETEMMRFLKRLENKDLSLVHSMTPLGSCTMKLNAAAELLSLTLPGIAQMHPFAPEEQCQGYRQMISELESYLCAITGLDACSLQPNSGAQGEYSGLSVIRAYLHDKGETQRNVVLIPTSAHGTNPASAIMAGMEIVLVACDEQGNINVGELRQKAEEYSDRLAALMITYPSTHGVFEEAVVEISDIIHQNGGQVYMDGANMNAQVGLTSPAMIHADVCHLNLHKTFAIPHGGGGPGVGPICCAAHLSPFLPGHSILKNNGKNVHAVSSAPWGSAAILSISYAYIRMMGSKGLAQASSMAILNANYIKSRLEDHYPVLYSGKNGTVAHELILDIHGIRNDSGISAEDISKRLMDYGFHAPTVSFPVHETLMIEPTESESKAELDRFCDTMIAIRKEIQDVADGKTDANDNLLKNAPHTAQMIASSDWNHSYSREAAAFPAPWLKSWKYWPPVARVDNPFGDRNLICTCPATETYAEA